MEYSLNFGKTTMNVSIEDKNLLGVLHANEVEVKLTAGAEVRRALEEGVKALGKAAKVIFIPHGGSILPVYNENSRISGDEYVGYN